MVMVAFQQQPTKGACFVVETWENGGKMWCIDYAANASFRPSAALTSFNILSPTSRNNRETTRN
jgi:hypothetical protein